MESLFPVSCLSSKCFGEVEEKLTKSERSRSDTTVEAAAENSLAWACVSACVCERDDESWSPSFSKEE